VERTSFQLFAVTVLFVRRRKHAPVAETLETGRDLNRHVSYMSVVSMSLQTHVVFLARHDIELYGIIGRSLRYTPALVQ